MLLVFFSRHSWVFNIISVFILYIQENARWKHMLCECMQLDLIDRYCNLLLKRSILDDYSISTKTYLWISKSIWTFDWKPEKKKIQFYFQKTSSSYNFIFPTKTRYMEMIYRINRTGSTNSLKLSSMREMILNGGQRSSNDIFQLNKMWMEGENNT